MEDIKKISDKFGTVVVVSNKLHRKLELLRMKTMNLSITSHNLSGSKVDEKTQGELASLTTIAKEFKDEVEALEKMVKTINTMSNDVKKMLDGN